MKRFALVLSRIRSFFLGLPAFFISPIKDLEKPIQPRFILNVEKDELFINAGLQDRVIQVCCVVVYGIILLITIKICSENSAKVFVVSFLFVLMQICTWPWLNNEFLA